MPDIHVAAVIPARINSSRLPGKPLAMIGDRTMLEHVWRRVSTLIPHTLIATDSERIADAAHSFGARAILTDPAIATGTCRCIEAYRSAGIEADIMLNVQGDEPFIHPDTISAVITRIDAPDSPDIATAATYLPSGTPYSVLTDPNRVKVVTDHSMRALYFSRAIVPAVRGIKPADTPAAYPYLIHHGIYALRTSIIDHIASLPPAPVSEAEKLEQLSWLWWGHSIGVAIVDEPALSVDTPDDLLRANELYRSRCL